MQTSHIPFYRGFFFLKKVLELVSRLHFLQNFSIKIFFYCNITKTGQNSLPDCIYVSSYSVARISYFILMNLMTL